MKSIGQRARPPPTALPRPFPICSRPLAPLCPAPHLPSVSSRRQHSRLLPCPRRLLDIAPPHPHPRLHPSPHPLHQPPPQPIPAARCAAHPPLLAAPTWSLLMPCAMRSPRGPPTINQIPQNQGRWGKKPSHRVLPHHPPTSTAHRPPNADARKPILRTGSASLGHLRRLRSPLSWLSRRCLPLPAVRCRGAACRARRRCGCRSCHLFIGRQNIFAPQQPQRRPWLLAAHYGKLAQSKPVHAMHRDTQRLLWSSGDQVAHCHITNCQRLRALLLLPLIYVRARDDPRQSSLLIHNQQ